MSYLKIYFLTHLKLWWLYLIAILSSSFGLLFSILIIGRQLDAWGIAPTINLISSSLTAAVIGALPIVYANYMVAKNSGRDGLVIKSVLNHIVSIVVFYAIMHYILNSLINFS